MLVQVVLLYQGCDPVQWYKNSTYNLKIISLILTVGVIHFIFIFIYYPFTSLEPYLSPEKGSLISFKK